MQGIHSGYHVNQQLNDAVGCLENILFTQQRDHICTPARKAAKYLYYLVLMCPIFFPLSFLPFPPLPLFCPFPAAGMHRTKEGHREDVRHEVHEQTAVHRER